jgi:hypothetical protein
VGRRGGPGGGRDFEGLGGGREGGGRGGGGRGGGLAVRNTNKLPVREARLTRWWEFWR